MDNEIRLIIDSQKLRAEYSNIYSGSAGILKVRLIYAGFPDGLVSALRFRSENGREYYTADITDNTAIVPHEVIEPPGFSIALAGYEMDGETVVRFYPTSSVNIRVGKNGYGKPTDEELTESEHKSVFGYIVAQIMGIIDRLTAVIKSISDHTEAAVIDHPDGSVTRKKLGGDVISEIEKKADAATTLAGYGISDAYTKGQTDNLLAKKANVDDVDYALDNIIAELGAKADAAEVYTKAESEELLSGKVDREDGKGLSAVSDVNIWGMSETGGVIGNEYFDYFRRLEIIKADGRIRADDFYNREQINDKLAAKADKATTISGYGITDAYTKDEVDSKVSSIYIFAGSANPADLNFSTPSLPSLNDPVKVYNMLTGGTLSHIDRNLDVEAYVISPGTFVVPANRDNLRLFNIGDEITFQVTNESSSDTTVYPTMMVTGIDEDLSALAVTDCTLDFSSSELYMGKVISARSSDISVSAGDNVALTPTGWDKLAATVDLSGYVKNTDYASNNTFGVVRGDSEYGVGIYNGIPKIAPATNALIDSRTNQYRPIVPSNLEYAVQSCTDTEVTADSEMPVSGAAVHTYADKLIPKGEASGEAIKLTDHLEGVPVLDYKVYGNSYQETRSGKNLFDKNNCKYIIGYFTRTVTTMTSHANARTIYIPCEPDTTYTISRDTAYQQFHFGYTTELPAIGVNVLGAVTASNVNINSLTITTGADAKYLLVYLYNGYSEEGATEGAWEAIVGGVQIEEGTTATDYEAYGAAPSPEFPSEIQSVGNLVTDEADEHYGKYVMPISVHGKNLIDVKKSSVKNGTIQEITGLNSGDYCFVFKTYNNTTTIKARIYVYDTTGKGSYLSIQSISTANAGGGIAACNFSYNKYVYPRIYIACYAEETNVIADSFMVVSGTYSLNSIPEYEPYSKEIYNIYADEPLRKTGDYADYVDFEKQRIVRLIEVLDDTNTKTIEESLGLLETPVYEAIEAPAITTPISSIAYISEGTDIKGNMEVKYYQDINKKLAELQTAITALGGV